MSIYEIEDLLDYDVDSTEWLEVINSKRGWVNLFNRNAVLKYLGEINEKYCEDHNLCPVCRSELVEVIELRGEHFGFPASERAWVCERGCE